MARRPAGKIAARVAGAVLDATGHPMAADLVAGLANAADRADTKIVRADIPAIATEIRDVIRNDPVAANNAGLERKTESRVVVGSWVSIIMGYMTFIVGFIQLFADYGGPSWGEPGFYMALAMFLGGGISGTGGLQALIGRLRDDLPPMYLSWNPFTWLARRKEKVMAAPAASAPDPAPVP